MKCPECNNDLLLSERQGVEIDYCPACRGVWLDKVNWIKLLSDLMRQIHHALLRMSECTIKRTRIMAVMRMTMTII